MVPALRSHQRRHRGGLVGGVAHLARHQDLVRGHAPRDCEPLELIALRRGEVGNTADEAAAVAALMRTQGWHHVILVTTGWHMPRSAWLFKKAGVAFTAFPVDFRFDRARAVTAIDFVPKAEAWQMTETTLREIYGSLFYRLFR